MKKLIFALTCLFLAIPCQARIITVDDDGPADFDNIQAAINDANDGDTVIVADGIYIGEGNKNIDAGPGGVENIVVRSANGPQNCIIDGQGANHGFYFDRLMYGIRLPIILLEGFTITNCKRAIDLHQTGDFPDIKNCIITGNSGDSGWGNSCWGIGCREWCTMEISECIIKENGGPGILCNMTSRPTISNCMIINNNATAVFNRKGGGIYCEGVANPIIKNCVISGNEAVFGGGFYIGYESEPKIYNTIITGNKASSGGGLYVTDRSEPTIINCTIAGNTANFGGGFSTVEFSRTNLTNSIMWNNTAAEGPDIYFSRAIFMVDFSVVQEYMGNDPCFVSHGYWADANDPNIPVEPSEPNSIWIDGDYHLKSQAGRFDANSESWVVDDVTSPCIDAGNPGCPVGDEPAPNGNRRNMGAYGGTVEASKSPANWRSIADLNNDWVVDSNDLKVFGGYWLQTGECIPSDLNRSQSVDFDDFAIFGLQWSYPSASEPGMTFQIDDCNMEAGLSWTAAAESNEPRFSVWVEGRYIYFEDTMRANCCPVELEVQMTVEGDLITIYEIEHTPMPCPCMCDYPITATFGPFEDGTYTIEVYDNYGNSLGVVEVTIGGSTGPGLTYQIKDCNREASVSFTAEPPDKTRFTVTVEGLYIHFKDMMTANCCPDKLELEMTVEDNLITIYETEYTPAGCRCMCSFPITAMLGPFEPGTYTLEVYEYYSGFIGSTTVVIAPPQ